MAACALDGGTQPLWRLVPGVLSFLLSPVLTSWSGAGRDALRLAGKHSPEGSWWCRAVVCCLTSGPAVSAAASAALDAACSQRDKRSLAVCCTHKGTSLLPALLHSTSCAETSKQTLQDKARKTF